MASLIKQRGLYYLQFFNQHQHPKRKRIPLKTKTKRVAQQAARKLEDAYALGTFDPWLEETPQKEKISIRSLNDGIEHFLEAKRHLRSKTVANYKNLLNLFSRFIGSDFPLKSIKTSHIIKFLDSTNTNPVSRHNYHRHLRAFFRWLQSGNHINGDPTRQIQIARIPAKFERFLTPEELELLIGTIAASGQTHWLIPVIRVTAKLGLRRGEVCALRWKSVDLENRLITVENTEDFTTKTGRERIVPISNETWEILSDLKKQVDGLNPEDHVFKHTKGPLTGNYLTRKFREYRRQAGLPENINFHSLRHTSASWLVMSGVNIEAVRRFLGHSSIQITQKYAHLAKNVYFDQVTSAFDRID